MLNVERVCWQPEGGAAHPGIRVGMTLNFERYCRCGAGYHRNILHDGVNVHGDVAAKARWRGRRGPDAGQPAFGNKKDYDIMYFL